MKINDTFIADVFIDLVVTEANKFAANSYVNRKRQVKWGAKSKIYHGDTRQQMRYFLL